MSELFITGVTVLESAPYDIDHQKPRSRYTTLIHIPMYHCPEVTLDYEVPITPRIIILRRTSISKTIPPITTQTAVLTISP